MLYYAYDQMPTKSISELSETSESHSVLEENSLSTTQTPPPSISQMQEAEKPHHTLQNDANPHLHQHLNYHVTSLSIPAATNTTIMSIPEQHYPSSTYTQIHHRGNSMAYGTSNIEPVSYQNTVDAWGVAGLNSFKAFHGLLPNGNLVNGKQYGSFSNEDMHYKNTQHLYHYPSHSDLSNYGGSHGHLTAIGLENEDSGRIVYPTPATLGEENLFSMAQSEKQPCSISLDPTNLQRIPYDWINKNTANTSQPPPGKTRTKDKYRVVYSDHQRLELEKEFHFSRYITIRRKSELAMQLSLSERQIKIWFQNRRAKERKINKKQLEGGSSTGSATMDGARAEDKHQDHDYEDLDFSNNEDDVNHVRKTSDTNFEEHSWTQNQEVTGNDVVVPIDVDKNSLKCYQFTRNPGKEHENAVTYNFPHTNSNNELISHQPHLTQSPSNDALHNLNVFVSMSREHNS